MRAEIWISIPGVPYYEASTLGRIRRKGGTPRAPVARLLRPKVQKSGGHLLVNLSHDGVTKMWTVHRLVCLAFHGQPPTPAHEVGHRRNDPANNRPTNLRWVTSKENKADQLKHGTRPRGEHHGQAKLTDRQVAEIRGASGFTALALRYGVSKGHIWRIRKGYAR